MNHSVKSKTIRHDCHLLVRAEHHHLQTLVFLLQLFKSNRHELESIQGDELLSLRSAKIIAQNELLIFYQPSRGSYLEGAVAMCLHRCHRCPSPHLGTIPTTRFARPASDHALPSLPFLATEDVLAH